MPSTEERIRQLVAENLEVDGQPIDSSLDLNTKLADAGVSSMDLTAFASVVEREFNTKFSPERRMEFQTLADVIRFIDAGTV